MTEQDTLSISVMIPTFMREDCLERCLNAVMAQSYPPTEVLVVVRSTDSATLDLLDRYRCAMVPLKRIIVEESGVVAAMNAGLAAAGGEVIALTDDDAVPWPDWLERLAPHFVGDKCVAGVGGRDYVIANGKRDERSQSVVGKIQWFGRLIGNHRWGVGLARPVELLKGVNCAYRVSIMRSIGFDSRMMGSGAQVHWELSAGLSMIARGYKLIYDPSACVDHYEATRFDADQRVAVNYAREAHRNAVHNETLALLEYFAPWRRVAYLSWSILIGTKGNPGLMLAVLGPALRESSSFDRFRSCMQGRAAGVRAFRASAISRRARASNSNARLESTRTVGPRSRQP